MAAGAERQSASLPPEETPVVVVQPDNVTVVFGVPDRDAQPKSAGGG